MTADQVFALANVVALVGWVLLIFAPGFRRARTVSGRVIPAVFGATYVVVVATHWRGSAGGFSSLQDVALLFSNPWLLTAGWLHYLAFDLFAGAWEVDDARTRGVPHVAVVPCLLLTFLFGPLGWLCYLVVRASWPRPPS